jgi:glycosyltransferase involved in cell wall biosynthesis
MKLVQYIKRPKLIGRDLQKRFRGNARAWRGAELLVEVLAIPVLAVLCWWVRKRPRAVDVGLGPEPLINNIHHKRALRHHGYSAETFVYTDNFISSDYDINLASQPWSRLRKALYLFVRTVTRYKVLFIYFNGGPLFNTTLLRYIEPRLLKLARVKVVVMPFGSDVQLMIHTPNLYFRHTLASDYPMQNRQHRRVAANIERWTLNADWVISGCEWVYYMAHWDTLQLAHFSIDMAEWCPQANVTSNTSEPNRPFRIFHAPNHKTIKGTQELIRAVETLQAEGLSIELVLLRGVPNSVIRDSLANVDLVADQFIIGWYALFAIEAMALEKPVMCYLRPDLIELYTKAGLIAPDEIPLINTDVLEITERLRWAYHNRDALSDLGKRGRGYVQKHHAVESIGRDFAAILCQLNVWPSDVPTSGAKGAVKSLEAPPLQPATQCR